ncbi:MAG: START-like domain-containing protein [Bacteroidota bacterium]|nr:START-like domain-containing protein [Bacteroidota bacterium]
MEKNIKYELEYTLNTTPKVLYTRLATASGLSEWFADDVKIQDDDIFTFIWEGSEQQAKLLERKKNKWAKFKWLDGEDNDNYFEFRLSYEELTGDLALIITDFADDEEEKEDNIELWDAQIQELRRVLGL